MIRFLVEGGFALDAIISDLRDVYRGYRNPFHSGIPIRHPDRLSIQTQVSLSNSPAAVVVFRFPAVMSVLVHTGSSLTRASSSGSHGLLRRTLISLWKNQRLTARAFRRDPHKSFTVRLPRSSYCGVPTVVTVLVQEGLALVPNTLACNLAAAVKDVDHAVNTRVSFERRFIRGIEVSFFKLVPIRVVFSVGQWRNHS